VHLNPCGGRSGASQARCAHTARQTETRGINNLLPEHRTPACRSALSYRGPQCVIRRGSWSARFRMGHGAWLVLLCTSQAFAQAPRFTKLKPPDALLREEFTAVGSIRELPDGRILVSDPLDHRVVVANPVNGKVLPVGRIGGGPGEYPFAWGLTAIAGDSSVMMDWLRHRWTVFKGAAVVGSLPPQAPAVRLPENVLGADSIGHVLGRQPHEPFRFVTDSAYLQLVTRSTGRVDTIGRLLPPRPEEEGKPAPPFHLWESAAIGLDGWIAVVRLDPYRVDWRMPDGRWIFGRPIPVQPTPFNARERRAWIARHGGRETARKELSNAPSAIPPFANEGLCPLVISPDGKLLIERTPTADHPNARYDVINRRGELEGQIQMPPREIIQAFGPKSVYVVRRDFNDDVERIDRHPWP
jgi:hypothetical protein